MWWGRGRRSSFILCTFGWLDAFISISEVLGVKLLSFWIDTRYSWWKLYLVAKVAVQPIYLSVCLCSHVCAVHVCGEPELIAGVFVHCLSLYPIASRSPSETGVHQSCSSESACPGTSCLNPQCWDNGWLGCLIQSLCEFWGSEL